MIRIELISRTHPPRQFLDPLRAERVMSVMIEIAFLIFFVLFIL